MPAFLAAFLAKLLEPIVMNIINKMALSIRIHQMEKKIQGMDDAVLALSKANTPEERREAAKLIAGAVND